MLAWLLRAPWLAATSRSGIATVFNTGLAFALAGIAVALPARRLRHGAVIHAALCAALAAVAGLALIENSMSLDLGIDWPGLHAWLADQNPHPGRMAPNTALAFLVVAVALTLRNRRVRELIDLPEQLLSAAVVTLGVLGVASNVFRLDLAYDWYRVPRMAVPTGVGFLILGSATWLRQPGTADSGASTWSPRDDRIYAFLGAAVTLLLTIAAVSYGSIHALLDRAQWVEHTYVVRVQFDELISQYTEARVAVRSHLADGSGAGAGVPAFEAARSNLLRDLQSTRELVRDNPRQEARLAELEPLLRKDLGTLAAAIGSGSAGGPSAAQREGRDLRVADLSIAAIDRIARAFRDEEIRLLGSREVESKAGSRNAIRLIVAGNVAGLLILLYAFALLKRQNDRRSRLEAALQRANLGLETRIDVRTRELARANAQLVELNTTLEERIATRTAELEDLYNNAPCGYHSVDSDGRFVKINDTELSWLGYTREEVIGRMRFHDLHTPESLQKYHATFAQFKATGQLRNAEFDLVRKDGSILSVSVSATAIRDAHGAYLRSRTSMDDISERKKIERQLHDTNAFLDSVLDHLPITVFVKDAKDLRFLSMNRAGEMLLGIPRAEIIGRRESDFLPPDEAANIAATDREALATDRPLDVAEEHVHSRQRGVRILHTQKMSLRDEQGAPRYLIGISEDITDRKRAEAEVLALNADLQQRARELQASNQELESFSYSVSHDLRGPLRAIDGFALMLQEDYVERLDEEGMRLIGVIRENSGRMGALIDDLLALSRLGRQRLALDSVSMDALVRDVVHEVLAAPGAPNPVIEIDALPPVRGDRALLRQVWMNLVGNAVKYSSRALQPRIEISASKEGPELVYRVRDNGVGFDMQYCGKLFGVFQRLHRADEFPGTGVGLAIVRRVVERHGGRVRAEGKLGAGATFQFSLPEENADE